MNAVKKDVSCDKPLQVYLHQLKARRYKIPITYIFGIVKFPVPLSLSHWIIILESHSAENPKLAVQIFGEFESAI